MNKFYQKYLLVESLSTYDPYDIWKTRIGYWIKDFYNKNKKLALLPSVIITLVDLFFNKILRLLYVKQEYPIVRAQAAISLLKSYRNNKKPKYIKFAKCHIDWLIANSSNGFSGLCWGLDFSWPAGKDLVYDKNEPFTTHTPYVLEAIDFYIELSGNYTYSKYIKSIYNYYEQDVKVLIETDQILGVSYGTSKDRLITNAISYTLFAYTIFSKYFDDVSILEKRNKLFNFIKSKQLSNGSWLYAPDAEDTFIDCFHSCFVIKNIIKANKIASLVDSEKIITKGFNYLLNNFYDENYGLFKRFSKSNKPSIVKFDLYDNAEVLNLFSLLEDYEEFKKLNERINKYFIINDNIYSVIDIFRTRRNKNTLRWAVIPYLNAITKL